MKKWKVRWEYDGESFADIIEAEDSKSALIKAKQQIFEGSIVSIRQYKGKHKK